VDPLIPVGFEVFELSTGDLVDPSTAVGLEVIDPCPGD
jgi:hypothetical protein